MQKLDATTSVSAEANSPSAQDTGRVPHWDHGTKRHNTKNASSPRLYPGVRFTARKIFGAVLTLFLVSILSFLLMRLSPVDPAEAYVKRHTAIVTDAQIEAARIELGLDQPLVMQYLQWCVNALQGDFGISLESGLPVSHELAKAIPVTLMVVVYAAVIMIIGVLAVGCMGYVLRHRALGAGINFLCILGVSIPAFYFAILAVDMGAVKWGLFAVASQTGLMRYLPAAICLSIIGIAMYSQLLSKSLEREMNEDHVIYARCRGLSETRILIKHALPAALIDLVPSFGQMIGLCLVNAAIIERIFSLPGLGYTIIDAVMARDSSMMHASVLFLAAVLVLIDVVSALVQKALSSQNTGFLRRKKKAVL